MPSFNLPSILTLLFALICLSQGFELEKRAECVIAANNNGTDDTTAILAAFRKCRSHGRIIFQNTTYHINQVMTTTDLVETNIEIHGTLLWGANTSYWLNNPQYIGFQNGSAAWFLGGTNVTVDGFGYGTLDGNGQVWYDLVKGQSNYPNRPHGLAVWHGDNMEFRGLRLVQSQMWTMAVMWSKNILFDGLFIKSVSTSGQPARNTDGADTIYSDRITFRNMYIRNGDDAIAIKGNSTNILIEDSTFDKSLGLAFGSVGQYFGEFERIENVVARRITGNGTRYGAYVKTWTGNQVGYPPNGGGGGVGYLKNVSLSDFTLSALQLEPFLIGQCTTFSGTTGDCNSSSFKISNLTITGWRGDSNTSYAANMDCSKSSGGCEDITITDHVIIGTQTGAVSTRYRCSDVTNTHGFTCN